MYQTWFSIHLGWQASWRLWSTTWMATTLSSLLPKPIILQWTLQSLPSRLNIMWHENNFMMFFKLPSFARDNLEGKKQEVMILFSKCTKDDVSLNNYFQRAKTFDCIYNPWSHIDLHTYIIFPFLLLRSIKTKSTGGNSEKGGSGKSGATKRPKAPTKTEPEEPESAPAPKKRRAKTTE